MPATQTKRSPGRNTTKQKHALSTYIDDQQHLLLAEKYSAFNISMFCKIIKPGNKHIIPTLQHILSAFQMSIKN